MIRRVPFICGTCQYGLREVLRPFPAAVRPATVSCAASRRSPLPRRSPPQFSAFAAVTGPTLCLLPHDSGLDRAARARWRRRLRRLGRLAGLRRLRRLGGGRGARRLAWLGHDLGGRDRGRLRRCSRRLHLWLLWLFLRSGRRWRSRVVGVATLRARNAAAVGGFRFKSFSRLASSVGSGVRRANRVAVGVADGVSVLVGDGSGVGDGCTVQVAVHVAGGAMGNVAAGRGRLCVRRGLTGEAKNVIPASSVSATPAPSCRHSGGTTDLRRGLCCASASCIRSRPATRAARDKVGQRVVRRR